MKQLEEFSTLLHSVYEGATNPAAWFNIVGTVSNWVAAEKAVLVTSYLVIEQGGFAFWHNIDQADITLWSTRYAADNVWASRFEDKQLLNTGNVVLGTELLPDKELLETVWYREFLSRADIFHLLGGVVFGKDYPEYPVCFMALFRGVIAAPFDDKTRKRLQLVMPHLSRALGVMLKLRDAEFRVAASLTALNQIRTGILLLDAQGKVCFAKEAAERVCQRADGLYLKAGAGSRSTLRATHPGAQSSIEQALRSAVRVSAEDVEHFTHAVCVARPSGLADYAVQVSYLSETNPYQMGLTVPRAIVFIKDNAQLGKPDADLLMRTYGLTRAEVRAALALCDGGNLESVAGQLQLGVNTLKSHLRSIYSKTSINSRSALTKLLLSLASH